MSSKAVQIRMPLEVYEPLREMAAERRRSVSYLIIEAVREVVGEITPRESQTAGPGPDLAAAIKRSEEAGAPVKRAREIPPATVKAMEREARRRPVRRGDAMPLDAVSTVTVEAGQLERGKATVKPDLVHVAPTKDNLPGPRPQFGKKKAEPKKTVTRQGYRELAGDEEARAAMLAKMNAGPLTVEEQCQPDEQGRYRKCAHGRNIFRCAATVCKVTTNR